MRSILVIATAAVLFIATTEAYGLTVSGPLIKWRMEDGGWRSAAVVFEGNQVVEVIDVESARTIWPRTADMIQQPQVAEAKGIGVHWINRIYGAIGTAAGVWLAATSEDEETGDTDWTKFTFGVFGGACGILVFIDETVRLVLRLPGGIEVTLDRPIETARATGGTVMFPSIGTPAAQGRFSFGAGSMRGGGKVVASMSF